MTKEDHKKLLALQFPIFSYEDYDFGFQFPLWPIGLKSTYPEELVRRIAAAVISYSQGNSAIDYTYKTYLKDKSYEMNDGSRIDLRIAGSISGRMRAFADLIFLVTAHEEKRQGEILCEWTFLRTPFAINFLLSCAQKGAFFESAAVARMILEQIAWAIGINALEDNSQIQNSSATKAIGLLRKICPAAGELYGWLSDHAHWAYEAHVKAMTVTEGRLTALFATNLFKARSLALTILMSLVAEAAFVSTKKDTIERALDQLHRKPMKRQSDKDDFLGHHSQLNAAELRTFLEENSLPALMSELKDKSANDNDLIELSRMAARLAA
jgi:hypothetical protein